MLTNCGRRCVFCGLNPSPGVARRIHSDNLELSEQFDATTGYEKSVSNLSWSYASFLSAIRARTAS